jgi:hypothetical protein
MRRLYFVLLMVCGTAVPVFGQGTTQSDSQTLQALLTEVRELRKDLRASLGEIHSAQILLSRLQIEEVAVTRASQHLDEARSKLAEVRVVMKSEEAEIKRFEDASHGEDAAQADDELSRAKADLAASSELAQQRQVTETEAEQQLQTEQDKLSTLEAQLDEIVRTMRSPDEQPVRVPQKQEK